MAENISINLPDGTLAVQRSLAEPDAPVLVLLHGWLDNSASFQTLLPLLAGRFNLYAPDWPGHGQSFHRAEGHFQTFQDYADVLHQFVLMLQRPVFLVGHSLGGMVASCYAGAFPENVAGFIAIEALGPLSEPAEGAATRLRAGLHSRVKYRDTAKRILRDEEQALKLRRKGSGLTNDQLRPMVTRSLESREEGLVWRHDSRLKAVSPYRMDDGQARAFVQAICCPVLAILGTEAILSFGACRDKHVTAGFGI